MYIILDINFRSKDLKSKYLILEYVQQFAVCLMLRDLFKVMSS
jgi:hypothetical protein